MPNDNIMPDTEDKVIELVFNAGGRKAKIRREKMDGKDYVVAPASILAEGVVPGSEGALFYPDEEIANSAPVWDHKPLLNYHSEDSKGRPIRAADPKILEEQGLGVLMRTVHNTKLRTECWFDEEKTNRVNNKIIPALERGEKIEVSTGLAASVQWKKGKHNGVDYVGIVRNFKPDHLAVLMDQEGAYSIAKGGGLLANKSTETEEQIENALSFSDINSQLCELLCSTYGKPGHSWNGWIVDVFPSSVVYYQNYEMYSQSYSITGGDTVKLKGKPVPVHRVTSYQTEEGSMVGNALTGQLSLDQEIDMTKQQKIEFLLANGYKPEQKDWLASLSDDNLETMYVIANKKPEPVKETVTEKTEEGKEKAAPIANSNPLGLTPESSLQDWVNAMPPALGEMVVNSVNAAEAEKKELITAIVANKEAGYTETELANKKWTLPELRKLHKVICPQVHNTKTKGGSESESNTVLYFGGSGGPAPTDGSGTAPQKPLIVNRSRGAVEKKKETVA